MSQSYRVELNTTVYKVEIPNDSYPVATCARSMNLTSGVTSYNTRTGAVTSQTGDYTAEQITETATAKIMTGDERAKLAGVETGAEVNNISDVNATDLTDGGSTSLHGHPDSAISSPVAVDISGDVSGGSVAITYTDAKRDQYADLGSASTLTISGITGVSYGDDFRLWLKTSNADLTLTLPTSETNISGALTASNVWILLIITKDPGGTLRIVSTAEVS